MRRESRQLWTITLLTLTLCLAGAASAAAAGITVDPTMVTWDAAAGYRLTLSVSGPGDFHRRQVFEAGEAPNFGASSDSGDLLADGVYNWQLVASPLKAASRSGGARSEVTALREVEGSTRSGAFSLAGGAFLSPDLPEEAGTEKDQVFLDDLIVNGSICAGLDCVNGESFGFDTLRLKENNLRIRFVDTSNSSSFPTRDWQITVNDSSNGGRNKFSIDDVDGGRTPFTIEAGAPSHSLYVEDGGRVGFGTSTPVVELHVVDGNTPTLRLAQDGSDGFTPQTWDVAGNETNFFVRDATNGSTLPFKIKPGAPDNSLFVAASGNVGIGTTSPDANLHVRKTASGTATLAHFENNGRVRVEIENTSISGTAGSSWNLDVNNNGLFAIAEANDSDIEFQIDAAGNVTAAGTITPMSSRTAKENFAGVDVAQVLGMVTELPLATWNYKADHPSVRHLSPMAEDFRAAFGLGKDDKGISVTDLSGVALASIQALAEQNSQLSSKVEELEALIEALSARASE